MQIKFNGDIVTVTCPQTLMTLLKTFAIESHTPGIAVAMNEQILSRSEWSFTWIKEGDSIEVIHAVQGG